MVPHGFDLKPVRGRTLPLFTDPEIAAPDLLKLDVQKMKVFYKEMDEGPSISFCIVLLYPDCSEVVHVPGTERPFTLDEYKKEIGKTYCRISLFICLEKDFREVDGGPESDLDPEIVITTRSRAEFNQADTVIVISDSEDNLNSPGCSLAKSTSYSRYIVLYAPCVEEEDEPVPVNTESIPDMTENADFTLLDIIKNLSHPIDHGRVSRFNISRSNVWDGAIRGFKHATYSETCDMLVKFTDDAGAFEDGTDAGGPRREFLTLLMKQLRDRPIFDGPPGQRFLIYNANAVREDEYYLAGKIAVSVVHGGPGPHFLSEDLVLTLQIESAASVEALQECTLRFKEGLSDLNFLALQQYPTLLATVLPHSEKKLTALELDRLFKPDLSPSGSNRRLREGQMLGYWADYLLDCEEGQAAVCVDDISMFVSGLTSLPPSGLEPVPKIEFLDDSPFPMANSCSNKLNLPFFDSYNVFKSNMDFGIQNSPGFGHF